MAVSAPIRHAAGQKLDDAAIAPHRSGELRDVAAEKPMPALRALAKRQGLKGLLAALRQRYPRHARS